MNPKLEILCNLYDRSDENINVDALLKVCFFKNFREVMYSLSHKQCVKFAYLCAKSVSHLINSEDVREKTEKCSKLVEKWLENPDSVSNDELRRVANPIYNIHYYNAPAYAAICSADAANSSYDSAIYANSTIIYSTDAAENKQEQKYKNLGFLVKVIKDG